MNKHGYLVRQDQSLKGNGRHKENYPYYSHPITLDFFEAGKTRNRKMLGTVWVLILCEHQPTTVINPKQYGWEFCISFKKRKEKPGAAQEMHS